MMKRDAPFLIAGALGLLAALIGAIGAPRLRVGEDAAAFVNGVAIPRAAYARATEALRADSRNPVTPQREADVLERLIDEELLVQHALDLGLAETDAAARRALVQAAMELARAERAGEEPSEQQLRAFFAQNAGLFESPPRIVVSVAFVRAGRDAEAVRRALAQGGKAATVSDPMAASPPHAPLTQSELARYTNPALSAAIAGLGPGDVTAPIPAQGGAFVARLDSFIAAPSPRYEDVASQVRYEWDRRADEEAVRDRLDRLKRTARIERRAP